MFSPKGFRALAAIIVFSLLALACSLGNIAADVASSVSKEISSTEVDDSGAPAEQGVQDQQAPPSIKIPVGPPTPTPFVYDGPLPDAGKGGVYGRILWNGQPIEGLEVKLCDEIKFIGGCRGAEYPTRTGVDGVYVIINVPPGGYGLTYKALEGESWFFMTSGFLNARDFELKAGEMVNIGDKNTVRTDVVITKPAEDERISAVRRPVLEWQAYPQAAYYELTFHSGRGGSLIHRMQLTEPRFEMNRDLQSCGYTFKVEVFNSQEVQIAENDGWHNFQIGGLPESCEMTATSPADGATVKANEITLTWQPHAWAKVYKIHFYKKGESSTKILDFVETTEASYVVTQAVPTGQYEWVVYGYDEFGDGLGFTNSFTLNVSSP